MNINYEMNAILVYKQSVYTEMEFTDTILRSLTGALPQMFLTISGVARISSHKLEKSKSEGLQAFPHWMYYIGEFNQWVDGSTQVSPLFHSVSLNFYVLF